MTLNSEPAFQWWPGWIRRQYPRSHPWEGTLPAAWCQTTSSKKLQINHQETKWVWTLEKVWNQTNPVSMVLMSWCRSMHRNENSFWKIKTAGKTITDISQQRHVNNVTGSFSISWQSFYYSLTLSCRYREKCCSGTATLQRNQLLSCLEIGHVKTSQNKTSVEFFSDSFTKNISFTRNLIFRVFQQLKNLCHGLLQRWRGSRQQPDGASGMYV